jgi:epoxide hydrolase-like predicted phosphatase
MLDGVRDERPRALVMDWGGVLTPAMEETIRAWADTDRIDLAHFREVMQALAGLDPSPMHRLERGELATAEFELLLATELAARGSTVAAEGLLARMLRGLATLDPVMIEIVRRARAAGLATALLSNSWGEHYPQALWDNLFDVVVISGRVGMRKPEPAIYEHTAGALGLAPQDCLLVDDLERNVEAATVAGMRAVLHRTVEETLDQLEQAFGVALR